MLLLPHGVHLKEVEGLDKEVGVDDDEVAVEIVCKSGNSLAPDFSPCPPCRVFLLGLIDRTDKVAEAVQEEPCSPGFASPGFVVLTVLFLCNSSSLSSASSCRMLLPSGGGPSPFSSSTSSLDRSTSH